MNQPAVRTHLDHRELVTIKGAAVRVLHIQSNDGSSPSDSDAALLSEPHPASNNTNNSHANNSHTGKTKPGGAEVGPSFVKTRLELGMRLGMACFRRTHLSVWMC